MSILDSLKLRFANPERQQDLARREASLLERARVVAERAQNIAYREEKAKTDPQSVLDAIRTDAKRNAQEAEHAKAADKLKRAFGLQSGDLIDTPEMRQALEAELGRMDLEQDERARQIADRAALLAGLEQLAMIDAARARSLLQEHKEVSEQKTYSREEIASMLAVATETNGGRGYSRDLDGWARSIADRERELRREEILLDQREKALVARLERELGIESASAAPTNSGLDAASRAERSHQSVGTLAVSEAVPANIPVAGELGQRVQEEKIAPVANSGAPVVEVTPTADIAESKERGAKEAPLKDGDRLRATTQYTREELQDPVRLKVVASEIAQRSGEPTAEVLDALRGVFASGSSDINTDRAMLDEARRAFWQAFKSRENGPSLDKDGSNADVASKAPKVASAAVGKAALELLPQIDAKAVAAIADAQAAGRQGGDKGVANEEGGKSKRSRGVTGFKPLGRNKSASAPEVETHPPAQLGQQADAKAAEKATSTAKRSGAAKDAASSETVRAGAGVTERQTQSDAAAAAKGRPKFRDLSPEQKAERRAEYMQGLRQEAGLTADGKEVAKEKGKEVGKRKGKQVDGVGL
ncbi:hypothetical protein WS58_16680 [Burkholderia pseudomultivorans]|uniref:hypothetical protein n=1 Tax=Burkholderia pseudomultivorans TaxID=1207504 RepID=UPI000755AB0D|nr:hypothetical protein [Burkholderia pseudomultivorans]AOI94126.1 hypothetical protein WS57_35000 [Burkholderia pseudomultivorans]KVC27796.1 hypothetical protein WS55_13050 [Burkholderia pseudomultivorans]KVC36918.1 hypothetical protein WS56_00420 [Burkholderia pseudomultivorans]KVC42159.1 hypothetical protein WS58_16680 [Burkholderia pseudomultivorans]